jgi:endonuclease G
MLLPGLNTVAPGIRDTFPQGGMPLLKLVHVSTVFLAAIVAPAQDGLKFGNPGCEGTDREPADRTFFQLCHSSDLRVPLWVGYVLTRDNLDGPAERPSSFREDKDLQHPGAKDRDYQRSGFARGHMAPAEDFSRSDEAIRTTFLLSNVVPQFQGVNGGKWAQLELSIRNIVRQTGTAYVFTGPIYAKKEVETIGDDEVGVPTHTFKVVLAISADGTQTMYAVIMPNAEKVTAPVNSFVTTVRAVENRTGFNFFSALSETDQNRLERKKQRFPEANKKKRPTGHK